MTNLPRRATAALLLLALFAAAPGRAPPPGVVAHLTPAAASQEAAAAAAIRPFKITVPSSVLTDLKERLRRARFPEAIPGTNWNDGTDLAYLKEFVAYWRDKYDWRAHERRLNRFDQFTTLIDGIDIHFVHQRSKNPNAVPLLLLNGWPSSLAEYAKVIMPLVDPAAHGALADQAFHVVIPSMPGFGFSGKRTTYGYTPDRMARMWATLMARLDYDRYVIAASDWGAFVGERVAMIDAAHVQAIYIQEICPTGSRRTIPSRQMSRWLASMAGTNTALPQTRGYGLSDSPVDLAAWILGAYKWLPDNGGNIEGAHTKDEMLTNITIWWVTNSGTSASRIYYETTLGKNGELLEFFSGHHPSDPQWQVTVPTGCAMFPGSRGPRAITEAERKQTQELARQHFNVVYWSELPRGGHFAAEEQPEIWIKDVRNFFFVGLRAASRK